VVNLLPIPGFVWPLKCVAMACCQVQASLLGCLLKPCHPPHARTGLWQETSQSGSPVRQAEDVQSISSN
jgi:hypothetical protein